MAEYIATGIVIVIVGFVGYRLYRARKMPKGGGKLGGNTGNNNEK